MDNNQFLTPTSFSSNEVPQKKSKKGVIAFTLGMIIVLAMIVVAVIVIAKNVQTSDERTANEEKDGAQFVSNSDYPMALNIYANIHDYMTLDDLDAVIEESGYEMKKDVDSDDDRQIYLVPAMASKNYGDCKYNIGYVQYHIDEEDGSTEEQEPAKMVVDIEYHECVDGRDTYIMEISGGQFRNYSGSVTVDYDSKEDAILNQLSIRAK